MQDFNAPAYATFNIDKRNYSLQIAQPAAA